MDTRSIMCRNEYEINISSGGEKKKKEVNEQLYAYMCPIRKKHIIQFWHSCIQIYTTNNWKD